MAPRFVDFSFAREDGAQRAPKGRGGGGSGARVGRSSRAVPVLTTRPVERRGTTGDSACTHPRWRAKEMATASSFAPSAERRPPHSPRRAFPALPQSQPLNRQTLSPPQQHSASASHRELEASSGPMPSHRQIRTARPDRNRILRPRLVNISSVRISPAGTAHNTLPGRSTGISVRDTAARPEEGRRRPEPTAGSSEADPPWCSP